MFIKQNVYKTNCTFNDKYNTCPHDYSMNVKPLKFSPVGLQYFPMALHGETSVR